MIGERQLSRHASVWHFLAPMLDNYVRRLNREMVTVVGAPLPDDAHCRPDRRAVVNETAFDLLGVHLNGGDVEHAVAGVAGGVEARLSRLERAPRIEGGLSKPESEEVVALFRNLLALLEELPGKVDYHPLVKGCGFLDSVHADLCVGASLVEVKGGLRPYRAVDLRQLLVYAFLALNDHKILEDVALYNPRKATLFAAPIDAVCEAVSGLPSAELVSRFVYLVSDPGLSR